MEEGVGGEVVLDEAPLSIVPDSIHSYDILPDCIENQVILWIIGKKGRIINA